MERRAGGAVLSDSYFRVGLGPDGFSRKPVFTQVYLGIMAPVSIHCKYGRLFSPPPCLPARISEINILLEKGLRITLRSCRSLRLPDIKGEETFVYSGIV